MTDKPQEGLVGGRYRVVTRTRTDPDTVSYRAEDVRSGEVVALLVRRTHAGGDEETPEAFRRAVRRWTAAVHPALPAVLDTGHDRGVEYVATEWPGNISLSQFIHKSGGLSLPRTVDIGLQLCAAFPPLRSAGLSPASLTTADITLDVQGNVRIQPAALVAMAQAEPTGSPRSDAAQIAALLHTMAGGPGAASTDLTGLIPAEGATDPLALAQTLAAYWQSRWRSLPDRPAIRRLDLPQQAAPVRAQAPPPAPRQAWDTPGIVLLIAAVVAVLGLLPLWATVYARYVRPVAVAPLPTVPSADSTLIPDLTGLDEATAWNLLAQAGLRMEIVGLEYSDSVSLGKVLSQTPESGRRAEKGSAVQVIVSKGTDRTTVPDVTGQPFSAAEAALAQSNLNSVREDVWSDSDSDTVISQDPAAGSQVIPGTTVLLRVSSGRDLTVNATLGDVARLLVAEPDRASLRPGETLGITLRWQALRPVQSRFSVFVHLVGPDGTIAAQDDSEPARGTRPTSTWTAGEVIPDSHALTLPANLATGEYSVRVGLYLPGPNERVPVVDPGRADVQGNALVVHKIVVTP